VSEFRQWFSKKFFIATSVLSVLFALLWICSAIRPWDVTISNVYIGSSDGEIGILAYRKWQQIPFEVEAPYWMLLGVVALPTIVHIAGWFAWCMRRARISRE
jgi:hypothetical protein